MKNNGRTPSCSFADTHGSGARPAPAPALSPAPRRGACSPSDVAWLLCALLAPLLATGGCSGRSPEPVAPQGDAARSSPGKEQPPAPTVLRADSANVLLSYRDEQGAWVTAQAVSEVPETARAEVLVVDLSRSPADRASAAWVEVADLRQAQADGTYPVRMLPRREWEEHLRPEQPATAGGPVDAAAAAGGMVAGQAAAPGGPSGPGGSPASVAGGRLIMYSTQGCPVCTQARRFLQALKIPFTERDVEADPAAARELQAKARRAGVPASGVPVFEYGGTLLPGFDKERLLAMLRRI